MIYNPNSENGRVIGIDKWDIRFLKLAQHISTWSLDPSTQVGAVIVDWNHRIVSVGFNGFARGILDLSERYSDRDQKYPRIVHAEVNAIVFAKQNLSGFILYTWPFMPCSPCSGIIINSGISTVITVQNDNPRWVDSFKLTRENFQEANVKLVEIDQKFLL